MTELVTKGRGRPFNSTPREKLARATLLAAVMEELLVANGRTPRGNSSMTRSMKDLHRKVATEAGVSLRWVERAWAQCREAVVSEIANAVTCRLNGPGNSDAQLEVEQQRQRETWATGRAAADAAWAKTMAAKAGRAPRRRRKKRRT
jgi:hypothetical protein